VREKDNLGEARALFGAIQQRVPPQATRADVATARNVFNNLRRNIRYTSDIEGVDTYQKPAHTLALRTADCDDYSTLTCATLGSVGIPCRYKVIRTKGANDWNHIYPQAGFPRANPQRWISMDSSVNMPFGWEAPQRMVAASKVFRVR
jgi:transglutaminase-like putative cysteine protease